MVCRPYVREEESTSKDKYHPPCDEIEDLTDSEIQQINSWISEHMEGAFVERVKANVKEIKQKRLRKTKGKKEVFLGKTVVEPEAEAPSSDSSTSAVKLVVDKMAKLQEEMELTTMELKIRGVKRVSSKRFGNRFVTRENSTFDQLIEVCERSPAQTGVDDSKDDVKNGIKIEMPGQSLEAFADEFGWYLVLTGRRKAK